MTWQSSDYVASETAAKQPPPPGSDRIVVGVEKEYWNQVNRIVADAVVYPREASNHFCEGSPRIRVRLKPDGTIVKVDLVKPAGAGYLDQEALAVMPRIGKLPPIPNPRPNTAYYDFEVPLNFFIRRG